MENKYYNWIDIAKGIGIILVILGHTCPGKTSHAIFLFHMPLFFIISGYLFNFEKYQNNFLALVKTSAKRLILPVLIIYFIFYPFNQASLPSLIYGSGKHLELSGFNISAIEYSAWFLYCLFVVRILLWTLIKLGSKLSINKFLLFIASFLCALLGSKLGEVFFFPWSFDIALVALYLAYVGYLLRENNIMSLKKNHKISVAFFAAVIFFIDFKYFDLSMNEREYSNILISLNAAILVTITIFYISDLLEKIQKIKILKNIIEYLKYLGKNSILILLLHGDISLSKVPNFINSIYKLLLSTCFVELFNNIKDLLFIKSATTKE